MRWSLVNLAALVAVVAILAGCSAAAPAPSQPAAPAPGQSVDAGAPGRAPSESTQPGSGAQGWDRVVIRTGDVSVIVGDVEAASEEVKRISEEAGGFVTRADLRLDGARLVADMTIQVPADSFDWAMGQLRALALKVEYARSSTQDVTEEFVDNEAQLRNLRAAEDATVSLMQRADKMEDILSVQRELTRIRADIERIEGRQNYLKRRSEMSTITVSLRPESAAAIAATRTGWQPLQTATVAWETSLTFVTALVDVLIAVAVFFWWFIPLLVLFIVWWRRRTRRRREAGPSVGLPRTT